MEVSLFTSPSPPRRGGAGSSKGELFSDFGLFHISKKTLRFTIKNLKSG